MALGRPTRLPASSLETGNVEEASRSGHAQELLGSRGYRKSPASKVSGGKNLGRMITKTLLDKLPAAYKHRSSLIAKALLEEADFYEMDPVLVLAMIQTESKFNPLALGSFGEIGLLQIKPDTAQWIAEKEGFDWNGAETLKDPVTNIRLGLAYVNYLRQHFEGSANKYISAYNMGAKNVMRLYASDSQPRDYSMRVMKNYEQIYAEIVESSKAPIGI